MGNFLTANARTSRSALGLRVGRQLWRCRSAEYRLHPLTTVLSGMLLSSAKEPLRRLNDSWLLSPMN